MKNPSRADAPEGFADLSIFFPDTILRAEHLHAYADRADWRCAHTSARRTTAVGGVRADMSLSRLHEPASESSLRHSPPAADSLCSTSARTARADARSPDPLVDIVTQNPDQSAEEIERYITIPIEIQMAEIPNVTAVRTISLFGLSDVKVQFTYAFTYDEAQQWVINRLSQLAPLRPDDGRVQVRVCKRR